MTKNTASYLNTSRRLCLGSWSKDVHHCRTCDCVWYGGFGYLRNYLLHNDIVLKEKRRKFRRFLFRIFQYVFLQKELNSSAKAQTRKIYRHIRQRESAHTVIERLQQFRCQMKIDHRG